jgi:hypothetical protein
VPTALVAALITSRVDDMDKGVAKRVIDEIVKCNAALSALEVVAREIPDPVQRDAARRAILEAAGILSTEVMYDITSEYPDLHPYPPSTGGLDRPTQ